MIKYQFSSQIKKQYYDVIIAGAGPSGVALALALSKSQYFKQQSILLLDPQQNNFNYPKSEIPDQRVVTLNNQSIKLIKSLGIWDNLDQKRLNFFKKMQIWELNGNNHLQIKNEQLGCTVENSHLVAAGLQAIQQQNQIKVQIPDSIKNIKQNCFLEIETQNDELQTRLLVGSDGPNSFVRKQSNIQQYGWSYNQMGIVCTVKANINNQTAFQRFYNDNIIALLPLYQDYYSIVYSVNLEDYDRLIKMDDNDYIKHINNILNQQSQLQNTIISNQSQFIDIPQVLQICNKKLGFPLMQSQSKRYIQNRVALIGDSAHQIHPLAGQGLNLGYNDTAILANNIISNKKVGNDIGLQLYLENYETQSKIYNYAMAGGLEIIKNSYSIQNSLFSFLRNNAIGFISNIPGISNQIQQIADGEKWHPQKYEWEI